MKLGLRRPRRGRKNPTGIQWALIAGGAATVGLAVYFLSKPSQVAQQTSQSAPTPQPLRIVLNAPPPSTFAQTFNPSQGITLKVGQSIVLQPPSAANPEQRWMFQATRNNASIIGLVPQRRGDNTSVTSFDVGAFLATAPGQYLIEASQFTPGAGGNTSPQMMNVLVVDPNGQGTLLPG